MLAKKKGDCFRMAAGRNMRATAVRLLARWDSSAPSSAPKSRSSLGGKKPVDPKVDTQEAFRLADLLHSILNKHGPLTVGACWTHAEGVGFKSKRHMKIMLRWMRERQRVKLIGLRKNKKVDDEDSMRYATLFYNEGTEDVEKD